MARDRRFPGWRSGAAERGASSQPALDPARIGGVGRRLFMLASLAGVAGACAGPEGGAAAPVSQPPAPGLTRSGAPATPQGAPLVSPAAEAARQAPLLVGFCGAPGAKALGRMTGDLAAAGDQLNRQIVPYKGNRPVTPVVELIATRAHRTPGDDGLYRSRADDRTVQQYLDQARAMKGLLLLNIQPGRADFPTEVKAYERWLAQPEVGVALDPEWAVDEGVVPGKKFGHVSGTELDAVAAYLAELTHRYALPDKVMVYHQVAVTVVREESALQRHEGVRPIKVVDGIGAASAKKATWNQVMKEKPAHVDAGFKLFYDEDTRRGTPLMAPAEVLALQPTPAYVVYE